MKKLGVALGLALLAVSSVSAREVNVVLKNNYLVKGDLVGISGGLIYLKTATERTEPIAVEKVSAVFDAATGERIETDTGIRRPNTGAGKNEARKDELAASQPAAAVPAAKTPRTLLFVGGTLDSAGGWVGYVPCQPLEGVYYSGSAYVNGMLPYDSAWGMGVALEYRFLDSFACGLDFGLNRWEKLLAKKDGYGVGDWVFEQTDYSSARVGPFPMDVKYYMDTTSVRLNGKYYPLSGMIQPYIGAAVGVYAWQATIGNREEEKKYSDNSSGMLVSTTLQAGVDFVIDSFVVRIFGDFASPVAHPRFENLFQNGWTYADEEHAEGPYRFGIALGMEM